MPHATIPLASRQPSRVHSYGSCTNVGNVREHNEDSLLAAPPLFAVADGMGGHEAGEVASNIAIRVLAEQAPVHLDADALAYAVATANYAILQAAEDGRGAQGMGTTLTAAMLEGEHLVIAQVGDSRAYLLHQGRLQQLTRDHSLVADLIEQGEITKEEAKYHPKRSVITRALGSCTDTMPDIYEINVSAGDRIMLCSDGLSGMVEDADIQSTMLRIRDPQQCSEQLVKQALANGGYDNVSVVVFDVEGKAPEQLAKSKRSSIITAAITLVLMAVVMVGGIFGLKTWVSNSAFLGVENGCVAVYQGVKGEIFGYNLYELVDVTDVEIAYLNAGLAARLESEGVKTDSLNDAYQLAKEYREDAQRNGQLSSNTNPNDNDNPSDANNTADATANNTSQSSAATGASAGTLTGASHNNALQGNE